MLYIHKQLSTIIVMNEFHSENRLFQKQEQACYCNSLPLNMLLNYSSEATPYTTLGEHKCLFKCTHKGHHSKEPTLYNTGTVHQEATLQHMYCPPRSPLYNTRTVYQEAHFTTHVLSTKKPTLQHTYCPPRSPLYNTHTVHQEAHFTTHVLSIKRPLYNTCNCSPRAHFTTNATVSVQLPT